MADSILTTTKAALGITDDYTAFDTDIILHINSVLSTLNQLGIGPSDGFMITDKTATWEDFLGSEKRYNNVKSYMYLCVRLLFDPPQIGYVLTSMEKLKTEMEWRINTAREDIDHPTPPAPVVIDPVDVLFDGYLI